MLKLIDQVTQPNLEDAEIDPINAGLLMRTRKHRETENERDCDCRDRKVGTSLSERLSDDCDHRRGNQGSKKDDPGSRVHSSEFQRVEVLNVGGLSGSVERHNDAKPDGDLGRRDGDDKEH